MTRLSHCRIMALPAHPHQPRPHPFARSRSRSRSRSPRSLVPLLRSLRPVCSLSFARIEGKATCHKLHAEPKPGRAYRVSRPQTDSRFVADTHLAAFAQMDGALHTASATTTATLNDDMEADIIHIDSGQQPSLRKRTLAHRIGITGKLVSGGEVFCLLSLSLPCRGFVPVIQLLLLLLLLRPLSLSLPLPSLPSLLFFKRPSLLDSSPFFLSACLPSSHGPTHPPCSNNSFSSVSILLRYFRVVR